MAGVTFKEWIIALKSGEYLQGRKALYDDETNRYCCVGVYGSLCGINKERLLSSPSALFLDVTFSIDRTQVTDMIKTNSIYVPTPMRGANYPDTWPRSVDSNMPFGNILADLNDTGFNFNQIADLLIFYCWVNNIEQ